MDKKYDFRKTEKELQDLWEEEGIYRYQNGRDRKVFSIDTPPPDGKRKASYRACIFIYPGGNDRPL